MAEDNKIKLATTRKRENSMAQPIKPSDFDSFQDYVDSSLYEKAPPIPTDNVLPSRVNVGLTGIGESQYDNSVPLDLIDNLQQVRATRQGFWDTAANAIVGGVASGLLTAGESIAGLVDVVNNIDVTISSFQNAVGNLDKSQEIDTVEYNMFSEFFKDTKEKLLEDYMPIYRQDPNKLIDFKDGAFYWEAFRGVVDSAVGFGLTGLGVGAGVKAAGRALTGAALRSARLNGYATQMARGLNATGKALSKGRAGQLTSAYLTNYAEGKIMALETYEQALDQNMELLTEEYKSKHKGLAPTGEDLQKIELDAKNMAGKVANNFLFANKMFMFTDYMQLGSMFKGTSKASRRGLIDAPTLKNFAKDQLKAAPKEMAEEVGQNIVQMEQVYRSREKLKDAGYDLGSSELDDTSLFTRIKHFGASEQALLEGAMGFFGGPVQYTITQLPFQDFEAQRQTYTSQQSTISMTEEYVDNMMKSAAVKEDMIRSAEEAYNIDLTEEADNLQFTNVANQNFMRGTTQNLADSLNELMQDESLTEAERAKVQSKIDLLAELETEYNKNLKRSNSSYLLNNKAQRTYLEAIRKKLKDKKSEYESRFQRKLDTYNEAFDKNLNVAEFLSEGELSLEAQTFLYNNEYTDEFRAANLLQQIFKTNQEIKDVSGAIFENDNEFDELMETDLLFEAINDIADNPNMDAEDKIKELKNIDKTLKGSNKDTQKAKFPTTRKIINQKIKNFEKNLKKAKDEADVESKGGSEEANKKRTQNKKENKKQPKEGKASTEEFFKGTTPANDPRVDAATSEDPENIVEKEYDTELDEDEEIKRLGDLLDKATESGEIDEEILDKYIEAIETGNLPEGEENAADNFYDSLPEDVKASIDAQVTAQEEGRFDELDEAKADVKTKEPVQSTNYKGKPKTDPIETIQPVSNTPQSDIKLNFDPKAMSPQFAEFFNNGENKEGQVVEYVVTEDTGDPATSKIAVKLPGKPNAFTWLYTPKGEGPARVAEISLREKILNIHRAKKSNKSKIYGRIKYQYTGEIQSSAEQTNIFELSEFNAETILYVDGDGKLKDARTKEPVAKYSSTTVTTKSGIPWSGALFMEANAPNGKTVPVKINQRNLNKQEKQLISSLLLKAIDPKQSTKGNNILNTVLSDLEEGRLFNLLSEADQAYLEDATVSEVISHLVHQGESTGTNTATQLRFKDGRIYYGNEGQFSANDLQNSKAKAKFLLQIDAFLDKYKSRVVSINKIQSEPRYMDFLLESGILTTDARVENGSIFHSNSDFTTTSNPKERYKTKAIYVENVATSDKDSAATVLTELDAVDESLKALDKKNLVVDPKDSNYYIDENGERYLRVSTLKGPFSGGNKKEATSRGTLIDALTRDTLQLDSRINNKEQFRELYKSYDNDEELAPLKKETSEFTDEFLDSIFDSIQTVKSIARNQGGKFYTNIPTLWGKINGQNYAGTVDIIYVNPAGEMFIIDLKTSSPRQNRMNPDGDFYQSYKISDIIQLSAYKELMRQRTGNVAAGTKILPLRTTMDNNKYTGVVNDKLQATGNNPLMNRIPISNEGLNAIQESEDKSNEVLMKIIEKHKVFKKAEKVDEKDIKKPKNNSTNAKKNTTKTETVGQYKGVKVVYTDQLTSKQGTPVAANRKDDVIYINRDALRKGYENKAWTKPRTLGNIHGQELKANALPENIFSSYEEWEEFVLEHEFQHTQMSQTEFREAAPFAVDLAEYENYINNQALVALGYKQSEEKFTQKPEKTRVFEVGSEVIVDSPKSKNNEKIGVVTESNDGKTKIKIGDKVLQFSDKNLKVVEKKGNFDELQERTAESMDRLKKSGESKISISTKEGALAALKKQNAKLTKKAKDASQKTQEEIDKEIQDKCGKK